MPGSGPKYYRALSDIIRTINNKHTLKQLLRSICRISARAINTTGCSIVFPDRRGKHLIYAAYYGLSDWYSRSMPLVDNAELQRVINGDVVSILNIPQDPRFQDSELISHEGITSLLSVPLKYQDKVVGAITIYSREKREFSVKERDFLITVGNLIITASENMNLCKTIEKIVAQQPAGKLETPLITANINSTPNFVNSNEEDFARLLDFYRIEWLYEPHSFPLKWEKGEMREVFTPDFYLPDLKLYIELTTLKQDNLTTKRRKINRLRQLYPKVKVILLGKKGYNSLLAKYGHGPLAALDVTGIYHVLFSEAQIQRKVKQIGRQISLDYAGKDVLLIGILKGMFCFMADLMRYITIPVSVDFMGISHYNGDKSGAVKITKDLEEDISGKDVIMVEDIIDTGMTLNYVLDYLLTRSPTSLRVCTLLDKRIRRLSDIPLKYVGFEVPDKFVVGYGLDFNNKYRNLPFIGILDSKQSEY